MQRSMRRRRCRGGEGGVEGAFRGLEPYRRPKAGVYW
jgi:hypothetical protein